MELLELTEFLVKSLVKQPSLVTAKQFENDDNEVIIEVLVAKEDVGAVIGINGKTANAVRTLVQAASFNKDNKQVKINIDSF